MPESSYLSGKVRLLSLPTFNGPAPSVAPVLKRLLLTQGELAQFFDSVEDVHYIAFIELRTGTTRGNHYHKRKAEFIYILRGSLTLLLEDVGSKERQSLAMHPGDRVWISPGVAHTLCVADAGDAVEFSPNQFDPEDVYRYPLS